MAQTLIVVPVLVQVLLTLAVLMVLGARRRRSMTERGQSIQDMALATDADWNESTRQAANNFRNQFELPVLFYVVAGLALATRMVDTAMLVLAVVFVASRIAHTIFHLGANRVARRGSAWLVGFAVLLAMTLLLGWRIVLQGF